MKKSFRFQKKKKIDTDDLEDESSELDESNESYDLVRSLRQIIPASTSGKGRTLGSGSFSTMATTRDSHIVEELVYQYPCDRKPLENLKPARSTREIRVGTFKLNGEKKYFAVLSVAQLKDQECLRRLFKHWKLEPPSYLLETNQANRATEGIISDENAPVMLRNVFQPESSTFISGKDKPTTFKREQVRYVDVMENAEKMEGPTNSVAATDRWMNDLQRIQGHSNPRAEGWGWVNSYLERKTLQALTSVASAAEMSNGWFHAHGPPGVNEKLLETAMEQSQAEPKVLVVDDLANYRAFDEPLIEEFSIMLNDNSELIAIHPRDDKPAEAKKETTEQDVSKWYFDDHFDLTRRRASARPHSQTASPPIVDNNGRSLWVKKSDRYVATFPWKKGTHYIFSPNYEEFRVELCGPAGFFCFNGESDSRLVHPKRTGYIIRDSIVNIKPCILFDNSGAETQVYARLIRRIMDLDPLYTNTEGARSTRKTKKAKNRGTGQDETEESTSSHTDGHHHRSFFTSMVPSHAPELPFTVNDFQSYNRRNQQDDIAEENYDKLKIALRQRAWDLREYAISGQSTSVNFTLADVIQIVDIYCDNPRLFSKVIVTVDPVNETPDSIIKKLTLSFARAQLEKKEVGAGMADDNAVKQAWLLHNQLSRTQKWKSFYRSLLYLLYITAAFCTTLVAVFSAEESFELEPEVIRWSALALSITVSFCAAVLGLISADSNLKSIETAQAKIVNEIFRFRMRIGKYSLAPIPEGDDDEEQEEIDRPAIPEPKTQEARSKNNSVKMNRSRKRFSKALEGIMQELVSTDLYPSLVGQKGGEETGTIQALQEHAVKALHIDTKNEGSRAHLIVSGILSPEDYFRFRLLPLLEHLESAEFKLRLWTRFLQIGSTTAASVAVVLSADGGGRSVIAIPVVIAFATGLFQILKVYDYERRFATASTASRELRSISVHWESLSELDHQTRRSVIFMVKTCEQLALQFATTSVVQVDKVGLELDNNTRPTTLEHLQNLNKPTNG